MIRPDSYPNSTAPSGSFPYGNYKDETAPGANDGTGLFKDQIMDLLQPWFVLMDKHSIAPSNAAETALTSQAIEALMAEITLFSGNVDSMNVNGNYTVLSENKNGILILEAPLNALTLVAGAGCDEGNRLTIINRTGGTVTVTAAAAISVLSGEKLFVSYDTVLVAFNLMITSTIIGGTNRFTGTTDATSSITGAMQVAGGISAVKTIWAGGKLRADNTTDATTKDTGSIITEGGVGVEKNIHAGGTIKNDNTTDATTKDTGSIITEGGVGVEKSVYAGLTGTFDGGTKRGSVGTVLLEKVIEIVDWNMNFGAAGSGSFSVAHGLTYSKIIDVRVSIRNDTGTLGRAGAYTSVTSNQPSYTYHVATGIEISWNATNIVLWQTVTDGIILVDSETFSVESPYDNTSYDSTGGFIRGHIIITYIP